MGTQPEFKRRTYSIDIVFVSAIIFTSIYPQANAIYCANATEVFPKSEENYQPLCKSNKVKSLVNTGGVWWEYEEHTCKEELDFLTANSSMCTITGFKCVTIIKNKYVPIRKITDENGVEWGKIVTLPVKHCECMLPM